MDPTTGTKKLQFAGNGTFNNAKASTPTAEKTPPTNLYPAQNGDDGIPPVDIGDKIFRKNFRKKRNKWTLIITFTSLVLIIIFITIAYLVARQAGDGGDGGKFTTTCSEGPSCRMTLIETIPSVMKYKKGPVHEEIHDHWRRLIKSANKSIDILSFYWTMLDSDVKTAKGKNHHKESKNGELVFADLKDAAKRGVKIRIVQNSENKDTDELKIHDNIIVRTLDMKRLLKAGIIHTKQFTVDGTDAYVGSANFDWRALSEVKELGVSLYSCPCMVADVAKIFETNWMLAKEGSKIPTRWPTKYWTQYNKDNPISVRASGRPAMKAYWSTSPPQFCAPKRTSDLAAILDMISKAKKYVYISVMDYVPAIMYVKPKQYWDKIDRALRAAVYDRGITVHLMASKWGSTRQQEIIFLKSLNTFGKMPGINGSLSVKMFEMPANPDIPYTRVSHAKYMVTDQAIFVSTSNWSGDYFENTGGVSLILKEEGTKGAKGSGESMHKDLRNTFIRDWESQYAYSVDKAVDIVNPVKSYEEL